MRMIPDQVSPTTRSQAEKQLFGRLRRIEDADWYYVLHSLNLSEHAWKRMSEIDFLLAGPPGIFVVEVKGGHVSCHQGTWEFTDRYGRVHRRTESPFTQARSAMFALEARLRNAVPAAPISRVTFGYGVAFPDCEFNVQSVEWAPEMVLDRRQLDRADGVRRSLGRLAAYWRAKPGGRDRRLDAAEAETLLATLRPDFDTVPTLRQITSAVESELVGLTSTQYRALDANTRNARLIFEGGAGTGKTMLAAEMCRRHAAEGRSVLFTCRSETLAGFVRAQPGMADVTVVGFGHLTARTSERFDVVVVDEAQDLINFEDLAVLDAIVTGGLEDGSWVMFMDSNNQRGLVGAFDPDAMGLLLSARPAQVLLVDNCRNTREIVTRTQQLTGADVGVSTAGTGPEVTIERVATSAEGALAAANYLDRLEEENISPTDIVLLSPEPLRSSTFAALPARWRNRVDTLDLRRMRRPARSRVGFARTADFKLTFRTSRA